MSEARKLAAILVSDVVGYSRLAGADEDRILAQLWALRSDLIVPTIAVHHGRVVKGTGDGAIVEFRSAVDAVRCAIEVQNAMVERNAGVPEDRRIVFRIGIHIGDVVEESDGDLMGDGVNIAARLQGVAQPGAICLSEDAYRQVKSRLDLKVSDLGPTQLKNIAEPVHVYSLEVSQPAQVKPAAPAPPADQARSLASKRRLGSAPLAAAIAVFLLLAAASGWTLLSWRGVKPAEAAHLSLVVLPFSNLSGDPSQDYFADGITDNLTTELSRIRDSFVIARHDFIFQLEEVGHVLLEPVGPKMRAGFGVDKLRVHAHPALLALHRAFEHVANAKLLADRLGVDAPALVGEGGVARLARSLDVALTKAEAERRRRNWRRRAA